MKWLFRPSILALLSAALALGAAGLVLWPRPPEMQPLPLREGDLEVAWLYAATNASAWERFVAAVSLAAGRLRQEHEGLELRTDDAFPPQTTAVPEVTLSLPGREARLVFRWYKLTGDQKTDQWVRALCEGPRRPPLAVIGGSSSDGAIELARALRAEVQERGLRAAPLLLLTQATADQERKADGSPGAALPDLYAGRTCRFCFTNRQMAAAVTEFVWSRAELRPDTDVVYEAFWLDDAYSMDLTERFGEALRLPLAARAAGQEWGWLGGAAATAAPPLNLAGAAAAHLALPVAERIDFSVGGFEQPNRWEAPVVRRLMAAKVETYPLQRRPLLVLPAASLLPARRFLRGLARAAPAEARRFVVVTGDALAFNNIYRDRDVLWPIQDLPFNLVFFCHRNPVDAAAGFPEGEAAGPGGARAPGTGTEDLLLYDDIVEALAQAAYRGDVPADGDALMGRLREARWLDGRVSFGGHGRLLFDGHGNRKSATGEHVVWLRPVVEGERVQPEAWIEVWAWEAGRDAGRAWRPQGEPLRVDYDPGER
jgi:hypothetical protein